MRFPHLGYGLGLVSKHYGEALQNSEGIDFFELISENFLDTEGYPRHVADQLAARGAVLLHGVNLSIGGTDPLDRNYLRRLRDLARRVRATYVSDHLCWTGHDGHITHDFLPMPLTEEALRHVVERVRAVQDAVELPLVLENPSTYLEFTSSQMPEWEFMARMAETADCGLLLDVNNVYVSAYNHGFDPRTYVDAIPIDRIAYHHLAGHTNLGKWIKDTHSAPVIDEVWKLFRYTEGRTGGRTTLIEWDTDTPQFSVMRAELEKVREHARAPMAAWQGAPPLPVLRAAEKFGSRSFVIESPLVQVQERVHTYIVTGRGGNPDTDIRAGAELSAAERLDIYREQYWRRVAVEMSHFFPQVRRLLGRDAFNARVHQYVRTHAPCHWNIFRMASAFPGFLGNCESGFAHDLARLELALHDLHDDPPAATECLRERPSGLDWEHARLRLVQAMRVLALRYAVNEYTQNQSARPDPHPRANWLLLLRPQFSTLRLPIGQETYRLIRLLQRGVPMARAGGTLSALDSLVSSGLVSTIV